MSYSNTVPPPGTPLPVRLCRHCGLRVGLKHRRYLCNPCYFEPGVRDRYPSTSAHANRGVPDVVGGVPQLPPNAPTGAPPGSEAKVRVLMERARQRRGLWHRDDAPMDPESAALGVW